MSVPIIFGAGLLKINEFGAGVSTPALVVGFVTAVVSGFLAIKYLIVYLGKHDFKVFVWYRFALAALIVIVYLIRQ